MRVASDGVGDLVAGIVPADERERVDRDDCLHWLAASSDIYRRQKPATPAKHLVSYAVLMDERDCTAFLVDHRLAGLWLPPGGHVEPGEDPADTARREAREELGIAADFAIAGEVPFFVSVTPTVSVPGQGSHLDVSLWYLLSGRPGMAISLDTREFAGGRWWTAAEIESSDPALFDPCFGRFLAKLQSGAGR